MSFACPHFEIDKDYCLLLQAACVPGRPGCVLRKNSVFWVPAEERLKDAPPRAARHPGTQQILKRNSSNR